MKLLTILLLIVASFFLLKFIWRKPKWEKPSLKFPSPWRSILQEYISFYSGLDSKDKVQFEYKVQEFLLNHKITGIKTTVTITDKLLVASSAIIPIFSFPDWNYSNLSEVLIYPNSFNENFELQGKNRRILGMVGTGFMEGKMILSKKALHHGFSNETDKKNTAIHEFVHLIDKLDGATDGIPELLMERQYAIPWIDLIRKKMDEIYEKSSDINPYGGTNKTEFFAVVSEYFFEKPDLLEKKHPALYNMLEDMFHQDFSQVQLTKVKTEPGRNDLCHCGSGKKYKRCCLTN